MSRNFVLFRALLLLSVIHFITARDCGAGEFTCSNGECVLLGYYCDGKEDCEDGSDELQFDGRPCGNCGYRQWECANGNCISIMQVCNGDDECGDNSDEMLEPDQCPPCPYDWWRCKNGKCLSIPRWICDGTDNCGDRSDEYDEANGGCPSCQKFIKCPGNNDRCLTNDQICNNRNDCGDWSEETEEMCPCGDGWARCAPPPNAPRGDCIPGDYWCDKIWDCHDGSDETNCTTHTGH